MEKIIKNTLASILLVLISVGTAQAGGGEGTGEGKGTTAESSSSLTFNAGFTTAYWYRGAFQNDSSISFGADYESGNFYLGTWWADVGESQFDDPSLEIDIYTGFGFDLLGVPSYLGVMGYYYTDNFDRDYEEVAFGMDFGVASFDSVIYGDYKAGSGSASSDYGHFKLNVPLTDSFYGGSLGYSWQTFTGGSIHYATHELDYSTPALGGDIGIVIGHNNDGGAGATQNSDQDTTYATLSIGYTF